MAISLLGTAATATGLAADNPTFSHTLSAGSNRIAIVFVACNSVRTITSVTYGGVACTLITTAPTTGGERLAAYYLLEASLPANGAKTVSVQFSGATDYNLACFTIQDAKQQAYETSNSSYSASATTIQTSITTVAANAWAISGALVDGTRTFTHDTGQNEITDVQTTSWCAMSTSYEEIASPGSVTQGETQSGSAFNMYQVVFSFAPADSVTSQPVWFM